MTPAELLAATAADMRAVADAAAARREGYPPGLHWRRADDWGGRIVDEHGGVVVYDEGSPTEEEADHIAAWDPDMARAVADWLDTYRTTYSWARSMHEVVNVNGDAGPIDVCQAWWKSRGREPVAP